MNTLASVEQLMARAAEATQRGARQDAIRLWRDILALDPDNPRALNILGNEALKSGDLADARHLLERAAARDAAAPEIRLNLSLVHRAAGDVASELAALQEALALNPYFLPALLAKADLLERSGRRQEALTAWRGIAAMVPENADLPPAYRDGVARARQVVADQAAKLDHFLKRHIASARAAHDGPALDRIDDCIDIMVGKKKVFAQEPTLLNFPYLPAIQFYPRGDFPELDLLEADVATIEAEVRQLLEAPESGLQPYVDIAPGRPVNQWDRLNRSPDWSAFHLWKDGARVEANIARCPRTAALLEQLAMPRIPRRAPNAFFSILLPGAHIPAHTGVTNTRLVVHLPLVVPGRCRFRVGNDTREWRYGKVWVFDDSIEHEAWNDSDEVRVLLIYDIWNPHLSPDEQRMVGEIFAGLDAFNGAEQAK